MHYLCSILISQVDSYLDKSNSVGQSTKLLDSPLQLYNSHAQDHFQDKVSVCPPLYPMSNYHSSPSHKCPQCEDTFQTIAACKHHIRGEHQPEIQIDGHPSITRVNGFFHCPKCKHKSQNARNFHRHPHIQEMKRISAPGHTSVETLQAPTRHSTLAIARSPLAGPSLVDTSTPATPR